MLITTLSHSPALSLALSASNNPPPLPVPAGQQDEHGYPPTSQPSYAEADLPPAVPSATSSGVDQRATAKPVKKGPTMREMMANLSAQVNAFAQEQSKLRQAFDEAQGQRRVLAEEVRLSREKVQQQQVWVFSVVSTGVQIVSLSLLPHHAPCINSPL